MAGGPYVALGGRRVIAASVTIPYYGAWVADVTLAVSDSIPATTQLAIGDLSLACAVFRSSTFSGSRSARLVAGYGGWGNTIPAQAYQNLAGVRLSMVLGDAAAAAGEQVNVAQDQTLGSIFVRESAPASRVLRLLAGSTWWIDANGVTQVGPRTGAAITSSFQVIAESGGKGLFQIATETISDWLPARTFSSSTVPSAQTIGMTSINVDNEGKLRLTVLASP